MHNGLMYHTCNAFSLSIGQVEQITVQSEKVPVGVEVGGYVGSHSLNLQTRHQSLRPILKPSVSCQSQNLTK